MTIEFPSNIDKINLTDFDILLCLYKSGPLWKMEITRNVNEEREKEDNLFKKSDSISKQAVATRVDKLYREDYLETSIISPQKIEASKKPERNLIKGYDINSKGEEILLKSLRNILIETISHIIIEEKDSGKYRKYLKIYSNISGKNADSLPQFVSKELRSVER